LSLPQDRLDLLIGKVARCSDVPDALTHRGLKLSATRHCFAVGSTRRTRGEKCDVVGDRSFNPFSFDGQVKKISALEFRALPGDRAKIGRWRKQLLYNRLAPFIDRLGPAFILSRWE
jgi:hypothetical protein